MTAALTPPPSATPKIVNPYDREHPCYSRNQMLRAENVLFDNGENAERRRWMLAINRAAHQLEAPCADDDLLVLVLTTIQLESGISADPPLENPNLDKLFELRLKKIKDEVPLAESLLDSSTLDEAIRGKLRRDTRKGDIRTEGDLVRYVKEDLRPWLVGHLREEYFLPEAVAEFIAEKGVPNPVSTLGPMQVNVFKATGNARGRGEAIASPDVMRERLLAPDTAVERGLLEGMAQLWPSYAYYRAGLSADEAVRYATADYNAGEYSSRNAGFQERVSELTGHPLTLDGDLLVYRGGEPAERVSNTESAIITLLRNVPAYRIRRDLLLEKEPAFDTTRTWLEVCALYRARTKKTCQAARVPAGADNEAARLKMGRSYTPGNYSRAYLKRWRANRLAFAGG